MMATQEPKDTKRVFRSPEGKLVTIIQANSASDVERLIRETFESVSDVNWTVKPARKSPYGEQAEVCLIGKTNAGHISHITSILTQLQ